MNYESAAKQFSLAYPAAALINHCHPKRTNLCCCTVSMIDERALGCSKGDTAQQCSTISLKVWENKIMSLISSTSIHYWYWCTRRSSYEQIPLEQKTQRITALLFLLLFVLSATGTNIWQSPHLEIMCSSCHLWLYSLNLFHSSSVCIATLLILYCCWLQWTLNFSTPHSYFFTHEWGAAAFFFIQCR